MLGVGRVGRRRGEEGLPPTFSSFLTSVGGSMHFAVSSALLLCARRPGLANLEVVHARLGGVLDQLRKPQPLELLQRLARPYSSSRTLLPPRCAYSRLTRHSGPFQGLRTLARGVVSTFCDTTCLSFRGLARGQRRLSRCPASLSL